MRCILKRNDEIVRLQDISGKVSKSSAFKIFNGKENKYAVEILNMRKIHVSEKKNVEYFKFQTLNQMLVLSSSILLNKLDLYNFEDIKIEDENLKKIAFISKEKDVNGQNVSGYFIVNKLDKAIMQVCVDFVSDKNTILYSVKGIYKWRIENLKMIVNYIKNSTNDKYNLSNFLFKGGIEFLEKDERNVYEFSSNLIVTNSFINENAKSNFSIDKDIFTAKFPYSEQFWNTQNQLPLTDELKNFLKRASENRNDREYEVMGNFK